LERSFKFGKIYREKKDGFPNQENAKWRVLLSNKFEEDLQTLRKLKFPIFRFSDFVGNDPFIQKGMDHIKSKRG